MLSHPQWIWLDEALQPNVQRTTRYNGFLPDDGSYAVVEFERSYPFGKPIRHVSLCFSGDTVFRLMCNGQLVATGPVTIAGDFRCNEEVRPWHYATCAELTNCGDGLRFEVLVRLSPCCISEYSKGHGGWMLSGVVTFADGTTEYISSDETWFARHNPRYVSEGMYDARLPLPSFAPARLVQDCWHAQLSPLPPRTEEETEVRDMQIPAHASCRFDFDFPLIYAGMVRLHAQTGGLMRVCIRCLETDNVSCEERFILTEDVQYTSLKLSSIGRVQIEVENEGSEAQLRFAVCSTHYPAPVCAHTVTSDKDLNAVLRQCEHALKHCRQMIHLDSPRHSEPLACTGDYYIETLMTAFSFGDLTLAEFDILRTAEMLKWQKGILFHTTYSLIWVLWLYDVYRLTGRQKLLEDCEEALDILLNRMRSYVGETGLIENPPSFMFVDWLYLDGISLHHPPKALGQSCLNMFYAAALGRAVQICRILGNGKAQRYAEEAVRLKAAINRHLFDTEKGLYCEGLNTPTPEHLLHQYMPQNVEKRYFRKHANILAVYADVYEGDRAAFLKRVLNDEQLGDYQPYFAHFAMEAVNRCGLAREMLLPMCERWKQAWRECPKGLQEGFIKPEPTYRFDHSHAWGGTPLYAVPLALSGLEILEAGMSKLRLKPDLLGLSEASVEIPTPCGNITIRMKQGTDPVIQAPPQVEIVL